MLNTLRKGAASWVAKIFIGLLVLSFAVWGISDIFRGRGSDTLATVGEVKISQDAFQVAYQNELRALSRRIGRQITPEQARALGIDTRVLSILIGNAALDNFARELNLGITTEALDKTILENPAFQDASGKFSPALFQQALRDSGLTEQRFLMDQRLGTIRQQMTSTLMTDVPVADIYLTAVNRYENEERVLTYFRLPAAAAGEIPAPSEDDIKAFYEANKPIFTAPEYRKLGLLVLTADSLKGEIDVPEEEIKAAYEARKHSFGTPERRHIKQISFPNEAAAAAARAKIKSPKDFEKVAKERGFKPEDIDLGRLTRQEMVDKEIAKVAFSLKKGEVSQPVKGTLATVLLLVTDIEPAKIKTYAEVKDSLRDELAREKAATRIMDLHDAVEDERAGGASLAEVAKKLNFPYREIENVDRNGKGPDGKPIADKALTPSVLRLAFEADVGVETDPVEVPGPGYIWVDVMAVTPEQLKPLDKVRDEVIRRWREQETHRRLAKKAAELVAQLKDGRHIQTVAAEVKAKVKTTKPLKRRDTTEDLSRAAIAQAFTLPKGGAGAARHPSGKGQVIFTVSDIRDPKPMAEDVAKLVRTQLANAFAGDYLSEFVTGLRDRYGVTVNQAAFNALTGRQ